MPNARRNFSSYLCFLYFRSHCLVRRHQDLTALELLLFFPFSPLSSFVKRHVFPCATFDEQRYIVALLCRLPFSLSLHPAELEVLSITIP